MWLVELILLFIVLVIFSSTARDFREAGDRGDVSKVIQYGVILIIMTNILFGRSW